MASTSDRGEGHGIKSSEDEQLDLKKFMVYEQILTRQLPRQVLPGGQGLAPAPYGTWLVHCSSLTC